MAEDRHPPRLMDGVDNLQTGSVDERIHPIRQRRQTVHPPLHRLHPLRAGRYDPGIAASFRPAASVYREIPAEIQNMDRIARGMDLLAGMDLEIQRQPLVKEIARREESIRP